VGAYSAPRESTGERVADGKEELWRGLRGRGRGQERGSGNSGLVVEGYKLLDTKSGMDALVHRNMAVNSLSVKVMLTDLNNFCTVSANTRTVTTDKTATVAARVLNIYID